MCGCVFACMNIHLEAQVVWYNICNIKVEGKNTEHRKNRGSWEQENAKTLFQFMCSLLPTK